MGELVRKPLVLGLVGATLLAALLSQSVGASRAESGAQPVLQLASELKPTHGGGSRAPVGYLPLHAADFGRAKAAANEHAGLNGQRPGGGAVSGGPVVTSYPNVSPSFDGNFQTGGTPPDTTGAIGSDRYIETVNTEYAIYSRSGSLLNSGTLDALTGISTGPFGYALSDPQMMWDAKTQRFYYSVVYFDSLLFSDNGMAVGWSKTATPSSASDFCQYAISFGSELPDYPKLGDSADFLLYGYNAFGSFASTYDGSGFAVMNKPQPGSSCAPTTAFTVTDSGFLKNGNGSPAATPVPANLVDDANGTGYVVANADLSTTPSANFVSVYSVTTNGVNSSGIPIPAISGPTTVTVPSYSMPSNAPQAGSPYLLDTLDGRFEAAVAAVDPGHAGKVAIWTAHSVFGGPGAEERWYEIDPNAAALLQSGTAGNASLFVWNGAVSPDRANTGGGAAFGDSMAMSVSTSSASTDPAIQFLWKHGGDPQSALNTLVQSSGPNVDFSCGTTTPCRWGDYSGASPDPAGGSVGRVWLGNQYNLAGGTTSSTSWRTWLFAVTPSSSSPPPTPTPTVSSFTPTSGPVGAAVSITGTGFTGASKVTFHGTPATTFSVGSDTSISATVPSGATTGPIAVTTAGGTGTSGTSFTVTTIPPPGAPTISSFTPTSGPVGTTVSITGTHFTGATSVTFNGVAATPFSVSSATSITAKVPSGASTGPIAVTTAAGTATSSRSFRVGKR